MDRMGVLVIEHWMDFAGVAVHRVDAGDRRAYAFVNPRPQATAQGAPGAYHPDGSGSGDLRDAGWPGAAWRERLVPDPHQPQRPLRQNEGRYAGYFVSATALQDPRFPRTSVNAYLDAGRVPYLALPQEWLAVEGAGALGDFVVVRDPVGGRHSFGVIGDRGRAMGELSERMAGDVSGQRAEARSGRGVPGGPLLYLVFPGSRREPAWPLQAAVIRARCERLLRAIGGMATLGQLAESLQDEW
ncbi:glycoside hydrolase family 75 protein [Lysobacter enzymogenes]|uniref:glycoside hydrolase family 75 protein n=1 Tax=Lysobacter enzymogenes TaxID=69 RepID=UPI001A9793A6|nr:glycoside hydrolase family 75 protein [Lysobacter enzymogenes]QQP96114.1 hypothetical protein JHW38_23355 [Lysobacter enzymogenes]